MGVIHNRHTLLYYWYICDSWDHSERCCCSNVYGANGSHQVPLFGSLYPSHRLGVDWHCACLTAAPCKDFLTAIMRNSGLGPPAIMQLSPILRIGDVHCGGAPYMLRINYRFWGQQNELYEVSQLLYGGGMSRSTLKAIGRYVIY